MVARFLCQRADNSNVFAFGKGEQVALVLEENRPLGGNTASQTVALGIVVVEIGGNFGRISQNIGKHTARHGV